MSNGIAIDIEAILRDWYELDVAYIPGLELGGTRLLAAILPGLSLVLVEADAIDVRRRFSLAHELGHGKLQFNIRPGDRQNVDSDDQRFIGCAETDIGDSSERSYSQHEAAANKFAAGILMPKESVEHLWRSIRDPRACANALGVSRAAFQLRLRELYLV